MASIANLVLADSVPANHTFVPSQASPEKSAWQETAAADQPYLRPTVVMQLKNGSSGTDPGKVTARLNMPDFIVDGDGIITELGTARFIGEFILPPKMTATGRSNLYALAAALINNAVVQSYVEDSEPAY